MTRHRFVPGRADDGLAPGGLCPSITIDPGLERRVETRVRETYRCQVCGWTVSDDDPVRRRQAARAHHLAEHDGEAGR